MTDYRETILILNGGHGEIPLINAARDLGFRVLTTGYDGSAPGHSLAHEYIPADFSDHKAILDIARQREIVGIVSSCNDFAAITAARVCEKLGLPGHDSGETCVTLHHKDRFRILMESLDLPSIKAFRVSDARGIREAMAVLDSPVIVKPIDLTGGKGMSVCRNMADVVSAVDRARNASRVGSVLIEEYLQGTHHGFTCFIASGVVKWWFCDDEQYFLNPFLVAGTSTPSSLDPEAIKVLVSSVESIAKELSLVDGLVHVQCILDDSGPRIIELCRRCPGDLYPDFVRWSTSDPYAQWVVQSELGKQVSFTAWEKPPRFTVRHCAMSAANGTFRGTYVSRDSISHVVDRVPLVQPNHAVTDFVTEKQEILFFIFPSRHDQEKHLAKRDDNVRVQIDLERA